VGKIYRTLPPNHLNGYIFIAPVKSFSLVTLTAGHLTSARWAWRGVPRCGALSLFQKTLPYKGE
jgi:hypothetical protein